MLVEGDTLAGIAYREYGDPSLWRAVAAANGIDDPMHLRPGSSVLLPAVDELTSGTPANGWPDARRWSVAHSEEFSNMLLVEVAGRPLPPEIAARLVAGYVDDSSNVPDLFLLRFTDEFSIVLEKAGFSIGTPVKLSVQQSGPGGPVPLLDGEVTALETEMDHEGLHTIVRGLDHSHRLFRGRRVEAYLQSTAADIVRRVAQRAGIKAGTIAAKGPVLQHVAQDGISDWDFLHRLAVESGVVLSVSGGELHFTASTDSATAPAGTGGAKEDPLVLERGMNLVALRGTVTSADQVPDVEVRGWDVAAKKAIVAVAQAKTRSAKLPEVDPAALAKKFGSPRYVAPPTAFDQAAQCDAAAASLASRLGGAFAELEGLARGNPKLRAGTAVVLKGAGKPFDGQYTLSSSRHEFSPDTGYLTTFTVSHESERSLYGVAAGGEQPRCRAGSGQCRRYGGKGPGEPRQGQGEVPGAVRQLRKLVGPHRPGRGGGLARRRRPP